MKLLLIDDKPEYEIVFKNYVKEWEKEQSNPDEDYYGMYKKVFEDYPAFIKHLVSLRDQQRLKENKPYVRFYWFINEMNKIVGTIRYRVNIPEEYGNIGFEISPNQRNKGNGRKMLSTLIEQLREEEIAKIQLTLSQNNLASEKIIKLCKGEFIKLIKKENKVLKLYEIILKKSS